MDPLDPHNTARKEAGMKLKEQYVQKPLCNCCNSEQDAVVEITLPVGMGHRVDAKFCEDCLRKALALLEQTPQVPHEP